MSSFMYKPTLEGGTASGASRRNAAPAFRPEFRRSVRMHPVVAGVVAALVTLLALAYASRMKPMYLAESLIYIEPFSSKVLEDGSGAFDATKYDSSLQQQILTAQRIDILQGALETLPQSTWSDLGPTPQIAAQALQGQLKIARVTTSYQVSISLKGTNPANTAAVLNAAVAAYLQAGRKDALADSDQRSQLLTEERGRIEEELARTHQEQAQLGSTLGIANPTGEGTNPFDTQLDTLRSELTAARSSHDVAAAQLAALGTGDLQRGNGLSVAANELIQNDAGLSSMKATINQRRAVLTSQMAGLTPTNPVYKQDQDELADLDKSLDTMTTTLRDKAARAVQDKLRTDLQRTADIEGRINGQLASQTARATTAAPRLQRAAELSADVQRLTARYAVVDNALRSIQLEQTGPGMAHLSLAAAVPQSPEPSRKRLVELAALPIGILCGLFAAVFMRKRDPRLYTSGDVDHVLGFAPIAILPARGEVSETVLEEYYLRLAAGVESAYRSGGARTFVLTPVSPGSNISPLVQALDGKLEQLGLDAVIAQAASVMESPAAETASLRLHGTEGLAPAFFEQMKAEHTILLLDSPAILFSAQTEYIARCADVTILVAESGVTTRQELTQSGALLQRLNVTGVGAVLEEVQLRFADSAFARAVKELENRAPVVGQRVRAVEVKAEPVPVVRQEEPAAAAFMEPERVEVPSIVAHEEPVALTPEPAFEVPVAEIAPEPEKFHAPVEEIWAPEAVASEAESEVALPVHEPAPPAVEEISMPRWDSPSARQQKPVPATFLKQEAVEEAVVTPSRNWFQKLFSRDAEPVVSILPDLDEDDEDEVEEQPRFAAATPEPSAHFDLPLPVAPVAAHMAASVLMMEEPVAPIYVPAPVEAEVVAAPLAFVSEATATPEPAVAEYVASEPFLPEPIAPSPIHVMAAPAVEPIVDEPVLDEPIHAFSPTGPARPLSFLELSQMSAPVEERVHAVTSVPENVFEPEPVVETTATDPVAAPEEPLIVSHSIAPVEEHGIADEAPEPEVIRPVHEVVAAEEPKVAAEVITSLPKVLAKEPEGLEEWEPTPLNRWDPIPPLRSSQEPWRSRRFTAATSGEYPAAEHARSAWPGEDPVRIPPTDHWGTPDSAPPVEPMVEGSDIVLTRRWGLLSRFQESESFAKGRERHEEEAVEAANPYGSRRG